MEAGIGDHVWTLGKLFTVTQLRNYSWTQAQGYFRNSFSSHFSFLTFHKALNFVEAVVCPERGGDAVAELWAFRDLDSGWKAGSGQAVALA